MSFALKVSMADPNVASRIFHFAVPGDLWQYSNKSVNRRLRQTQALEDGPPTRNDLREARELLCDQREELAHHTYLRHESEDEYDALDRFGEEVKEHELAIRDMKTYLDFTDRRHLELFSRQDGHPRERSTETGGLPESFFL